MVSVSTRHNLPAASAAHQLRLQGRAVREHQGRLATGEALQRAAEGPARLARAERLQHEALTVAQGLRNAEQAAALLQSTESTLAEMSGTLRRMRQLALQAADTGTTTARQAVTLQDEVLSMLEALTRQADSRYFSGIAPLSGVYAPRAEVNGPGLQVLALSPEVPSSAADGYAVEIERWATPALFKAERALVVADLTAEEPFSLSVFEGGKVATYRPSAEDRTYLETQQRRLDRLDRLTTEADAAGALVKPQEEAAEREDILRGLRQFVADRLQARVREAGLAVDVGLDPLDGRLVGRHRHYGSAARFAVLGHREGLWSDRAGQRQEAIPGEDTRARLADTPARGQGERFRGALGSPLAGLELRQEAQRSVELQLSREEVELAEALVEGRPLSEAEDDLRTNPRARERVEAYAALIARIPLSWTLEKRWEGSLLHVRGTLPWDVTLPQRGAVRVERRSLGFQLDGSEALQLAIPRMAPQALARDVDNPSGFASLSEIDLRRPADAESAAMLIDAATEEVLALRGELGVLQQQVTRLGVQRLRRSGGELSEATSRLRDADAARTASELARDQVRRDVDLALLAQANQQPRQVLRLVQGGDAN